MLHVQKTRVRTIRSLALGRFRAHETLLECDNERCGHATVHASEALAAMAPPGGSFAYDVLVFVGQAVFLRYRNAEEVIDELLARGVRISSSEVAWLARRFVACLALAHRRAAPRLKNQMSLNGGYILHLDGTCDRGGPVLMSCLDSLSGIVLGSVKVPSEKAGQIVPFLKQIKERYGLPLACIHDMGTGILAAVKEVFPDVPDFICHFHFLRDAGKDLLEPDYAAIRQRLRKHGLGEKLHAQARRLKARMDQHPGLCARFYQGLHEGTVSAGDEHLDRFPVSCAYSLICWALEGKKQVDGYGFPFDRSHVEFARRVLAVHKLLEHIQSAPLAGKRRHNRELCKLSAMLEPFARDHTLRGLIESIDGKAEVFDRLRKAMRMVPAGGKAGLNSGDEPAAMGPIRKAVTAFRDKLVARRDCQPGSPWQKMIDQIDKYGEKLFADPIEVEIGGKPVRIQPQRTNNAMERFFRDFRRGARRKSGHNSIGKLLHTIIADTPLIKNLERPQYVKILLDGHATLEECFAHLRIEEIRHESKRSNSSYEQIPPEIRALVEDPAFPTRIASLFKIAA